MEMKIYILASIGGLLPDAFRLLTWARTTQPNRGPIPIKDPGVWIGSLVQAGLGILTVYVLEARTVLQALAMGYAAPEFLTRAFAAVLKDQGQKHLSDIMPSARKHILDWWAS